MRLYVNPPHGNDSTAVIAAPDDPAFDEKSFARPFKTHAALQTALISWRAEDKAREKLPVVVTETHRTPPVTG